MGSTAGSRGRGDHPAGPRPTRDLSQDVRQLRGPALVRVPFGRHPRNRSTSAWVPSGSLSRSLTSGFRSVGAPYVGTSASPSSSRPNRELVIGSAASRQRFEQAAVRSSPTDGGVIEVVQDELSTPIDAWQLEEVDRPAVKGLKARR